jgi:serine/threonine protein phosphatase 1
MIMNPLLQVLRLPSNVQGQDYVIGDLHGECGQLDHLLKAVSFNPERDRLFSVGDLIDRGENSLAAIKLQDKPWFYAVRGNHEQMLIEAITRHDLRLWRYDWGDWAEHLSQAELTVLAEQLDQMPSVIVVGEAAQRFHIVHAALSYPSQVVMRDQMVDKLHGQFIEDHQSLFWSRWMAFRHRMFAGHNQEMLAAEAIEPNLSLTFCGHTPLPVASWLWSHYLIDQGAGYEPRPDTPEPKLTIHKVENVLAEFEALKQLRQQKSK